MRVQWSVEPGAEPGAGRVTLALSGAVGGGWLALGLGEDSSGSMIGADIVTARFEGGQPVVEDRFVPWTAFPFAPFNAVFLSPSLPAEGVATSPSLFPQLDTSLGGSGSWEVLSGAQEGGCSRVVLRRALATGDVHDRPFTPGAAQVVLWAYGGGATVGYHGGNRGVLSIDFGASAAQAAPAAVSCANCYTAQLHMSNYSVPVQETTYACQSFEFPGAGAGDAHAIAFYPRIDNAEVVHHILVHSCANDTYFNNSLAQPGTCGGITIGRSPLGSNAKECPTLIYGWAVGGAPMVLPQEAGVRVGPASNRFIVVEIHYNNRNLRTGIVDKSGVDVVLTKTLRQHDAGMLVAGDPATNLDDLPAGQPLVHRQGMCHSDCTAEAIPAGGSVTIFANFMHMHAFGRQQWSNIYRKDGAFKTTIATVNFWNFEFQGFSSLARPVTLDSGDMIFTHCRYDTSKMKQAVSFGEGSLNEMCMSFLAYYPVRTVGGTPWTLCGSAAGATRFLGELVKRFPSYAQYVPLFKSTFPYAESAGIGSLCNRNFSLGDTVSLLGTPIPLNRPDPHVWNNVSNTFEHSVDFGPGAPAPAPPTPAPAPADSDQALVIGLAVGGAVLGLAVLAGTVLLVKRSRGPRHVKEVPLVGVASATSVNVVSAIKSTRTT